MWREKYKELMFSDDPSKINTDEGLKLKVFNIPSSLYKYRGINGNSLDNLQNDTAWFSGAADFNDPYDSALSIDIEMVHYKKIKDNVLEEFCNKFKVNFDEVSRMLESFSLNESVTVLLNSLGANNSQAENLWGKVEKIKEETSDLFEDFAGNIILEYQQRIFATCFSEDDLSMLMWSHYADDHKGMVLEYDFNGMNMGDEALWGLHPVDYVKDLMNHSEIAEKLKYNPLSSIHAAISKSTEWSYEKEWRMILYRDKGIKPFNYEIIKPKYVILGARVSEENKSKVLEIAEQKNIPVKQIRLDRSKYGLTRVEL